MTRITNRGSRDYKTGQLLEIRNRGSRDYKIGQLLEIRNLGRRDYKSGQVQRLQNRAKGLQIGQQDYKSSQGLQIGAGITNWCRAQSAKSKDNWKISEISVFIKLDLC